MHILICCWALGDARNMPAHVEWSTWSTVNTGLTNGRRILRYDRLSYSADLPSRRSCVISVTPCTYYLFNPPLSAWNQECNSPAILHFAVSHTFGHINLNSRPHGWKAGAPANLHGRNFSHRGAPRLFALNGIQRGPPSSRRQTEISLLRISIFPYITRKHALQDIPTYHTVYYYCILDIDISLKMRPAIPHYAWAPKTSLQRELSTSAAALTHHTPHTTVYSNGEITTR